MDLPSPSYVVVPKDDGFLPAAYNEFRAERTVQAFFYELMKVERLIGECYPGVHDIRYRLSTYDAGCGPGCGQVSFSVEFETSVAHVLEMVACRQKYIARYCDEVPLWAQMQSTYHPNFACEKPPDDAAERLETLRETLRKVRSNLGSIDADDNERGNGPFVNCMRGLIDEALRKEAQLCVQ